LQRHRIVIFCGLLMSLSAFSIDISLPFFSRIAESLGEPLTAMPLMVTSFLLFLGMMQIVFGPLSDRIGRKPALVLGLLIYLVGTLVAGLAIDFRFLVLGRILQGIGAAGSLVASRAILRDIASGDELARQMSIAAAIFSVGPIVAPLLGALVIIAGGHWRWVFLAMFVYASGLLCFLLAYVPETNQHKNPDAIGPGTLLWNLKTVLRHPQSRRFILVHALVQSSMILIIATMAPLYEIEFGISGIKFALFFAVHAIGIILGQWLNRMLIKRHGPLITAMLTSIFMIVAGLLVVIAGVQGFANAWLITALVTLFAFGYLSVVSNTTAMVLMPHGTITGFTASLLGAFSMLVAASVGTVLGYFVQGSTTLWGLSITAIPSASLLMMFLWYRREGSRLDTGTV